MDRLLLVTGLTVGLVMAVLVLDSTGRADLLHVAAIGLGLLGVLLAVRMGQLLQATRRQLAERVQLEHTRALVELSHALAGSLRLDATLELVVEWTSRLLHARAAVIELFDEPAGMVEYRAVDGFRRDQLSRRLPYEGSFTQWAAGNGREDVRVVADPHQDVYLRTAALSPQETGPVAAAPLRYQGRTLGALACVGHTRFERADLELLSALAGQAAIAIESARLYEEVHRLSLTDPLTGLANRRQLERDLAREFAAAQRGRRLIAIMFDLNGFKEYNDRYGHLAGDRALRLFGDVIGHEARVMNMAARYGGDEFMALLTDSDLDGAHRFVKRVQERFPGPGAPPEQARLSVAAGIAPFHSGMSEPDDMIAAADRALYEVKSGLRASAAGV